MRLALLSGTLAAAGLGLALVLWPQLAGSSRADAAARAQVASGGRIYVTECAGCHGAAGEGQPGWERPGPDGLLPAPPHDATGHTWQHSDAQLRAWIVQGPAGGGSPSGYRSTMPAYAGRLGEEQVEDVIAWLKAQWPPGVRAWQAAQNPDAPGLDSLPGDWRFPVTCKPGWGAGG